MPLADIQIQLLVEDIYGIHLQEQEKFMYTHLHNQGCSWTELRTSISSRRFPSLFIVTNIHLSYKTFRIWNNQENSSVEPIWKKKSVVGKMDFSLSAFASS